MFLRCVYVLCCQCMYACLHMWAAHLCVHIHVWAWMCWWYVCTQMCRLKTDIRCLPQSFFNLFFIEVRSVTKDRDHNLSSLASELSPGLICHCPLITGITSRTSQPFGFSLRFWVSQLQFLHQHNRCLPTDLPPQIQLPISCKHHHACLLLHVIEK